MAPIRATMGPMTSRQLTDVRPVAAYLVGTFALTLLVVAAIAARGGLGAAGMTWALALMWSPGVVALAVHLHLRRSLRGLGWAPGPIRILLLALALPLAYAGGVYALVWASGMGGFEAGPALSAYRAKLGLDPTTPAAPTLLLFLAWGLPPNALAALGEEIGWRGFLLPRLVARHGYRRGALASGVIWAVYHWPAILIAGYHAGSTPLPYALACFSIATVGWSFAYAWLRLRAGSLWPAVLLHASHNLLIQAVLDPMTQDRTWTRWVTTEFGAGLALSSLLLMVAFRDPPEEHQPLQGVEASPSSH